MEEIKTRIHGYWSGRSEEFVRMRGEELESGMAKLWLAEIQRCLPTGKKLKILDVGTGGGFFAILLAQQGHTVCGIDLTAGMIEGARRLAEEKDVDVDFQVMDAEKTDFEDESFDVVVARNLTWTLPHPAEAYREWKRVLKRGGILLNFDGNYGKADFCKEARDSSGQNAHRNVSDEQLNECTQIREELGISREERPAWDERVLNALGYAKIKIDREVSDRIYTGDLRFYNPTPLFLIKGVKNDCKISSL